MKSFLLALGLLLVTATAQSATLVVPTVKSFIDAAMVSGFNAAATSGIENAFAFGQPLTAQVSLATIYNVGLEFATLSYFQTTYSGMGVITFLNQISTNLTGSGMQITAELNYWENLYAAYIQSGLTDIQAKGELAAYFAEQVIGADPSSLGLSPTQQVLFQNQVDTALNRTTVSGDYANATAIPANSFLIPHATAPTDPGWVASQNILKGVTSDTTTVTTAENQIAAYDTAGNSSAQSSSVFYVATNGSDSNPGTLTAPFATLGKAQQAMRASGTIMTTYIRAGTYSPAAFHPGGSNPNSYALYLTSADNGETWSYYPPDGVNAAIINGGASAYNNGIEIGIAIDGGSNITINGLQLEYFGWMGIGVHGGQGEYAVFPVSVGQAAKNVIENNIVHDLYADDTNVQYNTAGIVTYINAPGTVITNNVVYNEYGMGIRGTTGNTGSGGNFANYTVSNNVVYNSNTHAQDAGCVYYQDPDDKSTGIVIKNNYVHDCGAGAGKGIYLDDGAANVTVSGNVIFGQMQFCTSYHEGSNTAITNNICDLGTSSSEYPWFQQLSNTTEGLQSGDSFMNNIVISGGSGGGYCTGNPYPLQNLVDVRNNAYWSYTGSSISTTCVGNKSLGCNSDAYPTKENPQLSGWTYAIASGSLVYNVPVNFPKQPSNWAQPGFWGPPGYVIPQTGTPPSSPH